MPNTINDSTVQSGSHKLSITNNGGSAVDFVCETVNIERPTTELNRLDENGLPSGFVHKRGFVTGTATLQLSASGLVLPAEGALFTEDFGHGSEDWVVTGVSDVYSHTEMKKVNIAFKKEVASIVVA